VPDHCEPFPVRFVRGDARGPAPAALRLALTPFSWLFAIAAEVRGSLYQSGVFTVYRVPCPVISVGNLTVGGTGKTPVVEWLVRESRLLGKHPVVLSRGYGAKANGVPDELAALARSIEDLAFVSDPDRVRGALEAIEKHRAEVLILDDGFQHHRLGRDLDVVTVDATLPFGGGYCLPRGMLREPVRALRRSDVVVVTRSDLVSATDLRPILERVRRAAPKAILAEAVHRPSFVRSLTDLSERDPDTLAGKAVFAACGIGNPAAFEGTLTALGARIVGRRRFADHHAYQSGEIESLRREAGAAGADILITTLKDAVKWPPLEGPGPEPAVLGVRVEFTRGADRVRDRLRSALKGPPGRV
jgi:tetraacyldisaccharide 4'-kinase